MNRQILPPNRFLDDGSAAGGWWKTEQDRVVCELCPRECRLNDGDRGFCFVRENRDGEMVLTTYGRSTGFCIDPIEKKPLNHFYPGTSVLSFGTAGCNLGCRFCQNWDISTSREVSRLSARAMPVDIAWTAKKYGCHSVAFTYNDPVIWAEYVIDTAAECRKLGIKTVAVTAGYITEVAREPFFSAIDAANVDLKGFTEEFYYGLTASHLQPVLDTIAWLKRETDVWVEITNLIIPQENDSHDELKQMCDWLLAHAGDDTPIHFTAFHPDYRMQDRPRTPPEVLAAAYDIAKAAGIRHVYTGNVHDVQRQSTYCPNCGDVLVERDWYHLKQYRLSNANCAACGTEIAGHFASGPGQWGTGRLPVKIEAAPQNLIQIEAQEPRSMTFDEMTFDESQRSSLHREASRLVAAAVTGVSVGEPDVHLHGAADKLVQGAFVTLQRRGQLRACCGALGGEMRLVDCLQRSAIQTATADTRLPPISPSELPHLSLDVSVLHSFRPLACSGDERAAEIVIGKHGLRIRAGQQAGLLLPNVATEQGWDTEQLLQAVCRKAGLPLDAWRDEATVLEVFESYYFGGPLDSETISSNQFTSAFSPGHVERLTEHCRANIVHHLVGSTPCYYLLDAPDGNVTGASLQWTLPDGAVLEQFQLSWRPGIPLQSTLLTMTQNLALAARQQGLTHATSLLADSTLPAIALTVFEDPAMHGSAAEPDITGFDTKRRAALVVAGQHAAWCRNNNEVAAAELVTQAWQQLGRPAAAQLYSVAAAASTARGHGTNLPAALPSIRVRPAAVAGKFYEADAESLGTTVRGMLNTAKQAAIAKKKYAAAIVPHAGLAFSGQIAADVLARIEIPETVLIIGPKHTRAGVDWAIAPCEKWQFPGGTVDSDMEMAAGLANAIDGFQMDAAAHQGEHSIEVELPFLAQLAPQAKVVGMVMGSGDWDRCRIAAKQLAEFIRTLPQPPLLLVSSDMNHFLDDQETRHLDELALVEIRKFAPQALWETVCAHSISMCGVRPAIMAMEAVRSLHPSATAEQVGYTTSAQVSGDFERCVGYAGVLFG